MNPIYGAWLTTNRTCNNSCAFCYAQNATGTDMPIEDAKKCVDSLEEMGISTVVLIGGEPTIYEDFFELIAYITNKGMRVSVATNGRALSDKDFAKQMLDAGVSSVNISIKGLSDEEYIEVTKFPGCTQMIQGYHNLRDLDFYPVLSYVIAEYDNSKIDNLVAFLKENQMDMILFQFVKPVVEPDSEKVMSMHDMGKTVEYIFDSMQDSDIKYKIELSFPLCLIDKDKLDQMISEDRISTCCHVQAGRGIVFDTDFTILPCNHFIGYPFSDVPAGKLGTDAIKEVWESEAVTTFREKVNYYPSEKCEKCEMWDICGGGCYTRWLFEDPEDNIK